MNTTASFSSEYSWTAGPSRRDSTETVFSIQGKETDFVRDTSDTDTETEDDRDIEFEPTTDLEEHIPIDESSSPSDNDIIRTRVIEVSVRDDGDLEFADSEQTDSEQSDSEIDLNDYWTCAQCNVANNNTLYRYCTKCYQERKSLFPPRPKRKRKLKTSPQTVAALAPPALSNDSGVDSPANSQDLCPDSHDTSTRNDVQRSDSESRLSTRSVRPLKRRTRSELELNGTTETESEADVGPRRHKKPKLLVKPLSKSTSDPAVTFEEPVAKLTKRTIANSLKGKLEAGESDNTCIVCLSEPKSGVFVHGRIAHICCCYKCSVKVWAKAKRCPVCNCKVSNVLRAVVM